LSSAAAGDGQNILFAGEEETMKRFMKGFFVALVISALASLSAFAGDKDRTETKTVTFAEDVNVNGTVVKAGEYQVKFDEGAGELTILKNGKVKAKMAAHLETRTDKAARTSLRTREQNGTVEFVGVTFNGWNQDIVAGGNSSASGTQ
jgi:hypothetical protein